MVRLMDMKQRFSPLTKTKPRLHQSYFDLHDLRRKSTIFEKLKRRFSQSDRDLSRRVPVDISTDFKNPTANQQTDESFVVYNTTSSLNDDSHFTIYNDTQKGSITNHITDSRHSSTFDGFSDILDLIQGNAGPHSRIPDDRKLVNCKKENVQGNGDGVVFANGHKADKANGDCCNSFANRKDKKFVLNKEEKSERKTVTRISQESLGNSCSDACYGGNLSDCKGGEISVREESLRSMQCLSQNCGADDKYCTLCGRVETEDNMDKDGSSEQRYITASGILQADIDCRKRVLADSTQNDTVDLNTVVKSSLNTPATACEEVSIVPNPSTEISYTPSESEPSVLFCANVGEVVDQRHKGSFLNGSSQRISANGLEPDKPFPMARTVDRDQNYGVKERLDLRNYGDHHVDYENITGADVYCDSCRWTLHSSAFEKSSCLRSKPSMGSNSVLENFVDHRGKVNHCYDLYDSDAEVLKRRQAAMDITVSGTSRERSRSEENILGNQGEPRGRTRRLNSAPNVYPMSEAEKARLEKVYEKKLKEHCTSLKSAIKRKSKDHNGNSLRVRFDLSKSDDDLGRLRAYRERTRETSLDVRAKQIDADATDEQKKKWKFVMKKFRIKHQSIDFGTASKSYLDKNKSIVNEDLQSVNISRDGCGTGSSDAEICLESVKEFSLLLPAKGTQNDASRRKHTAEAVENEVKIRYVKIIQISVHDFKWIEVGPTGTLNSELGNAPE